VKENTRCLLELESEDGFPVGMVLFEIDQTTYKRSLTQIPKDILGQNIIQNSTFLLELNTLRCKLKGDKDYLLVAATYKKGLQGNFNLLISTETALKVAEVTEEA